MDFNTPPDHPSRTTYASRLRTTYHRPSYAELSSSASPTIPSKRVALSELDHNTLNSNNKRVRSHKSNGTGRTGRPKTTNVGTRVGSRILRANPIDITSIEPRSREILLGIRPHSHLNDGVTPQQRTAVANTIIQVVIPPRNP